MKKGILLIIVFLGFLGVVTAASVGTFPGSLDYEDVEPGQSIDGQLFITTNINSRFNVSPSASSLTSPNVIFERSSNPSIVSEGGSASWFTFEDALVDGSSRESVTLSDGSSANVNGGLNFTINIPQDAEPGIHYGVIEPNAEIRSDENQPGARTFGETRVRYSIIVGSGATRDIQVQDVRGFRLGENNAAIEVLLRNTGTVTASTDDFEIDIIDSSRNNVATLSVSGTTLSPEGEGSSAWVDASWVDRSGIEEGNYQVDGTVDYFTGQSTASGSFSLPEFNVVEVRPSDSPGSDQDDESLPLWLVFMVLVMLAVLMWSFDIEPFWILAVIGSLTIGSLILLTGISNYLLVVLLMAIGIIVYGVM